MNAFNDGLHILAIMLTGALVLYTGVFILRWPTIQMEWARKLRYLSLFGFGIYGFVQEAVLLGEPIVIWRVGLLIACTMLGLGGTIIPDAISFWRGSTRDKPLPQIKSKRR